ncbi:hypothetical protein [Paenibacillus ferrarius]|uniref:hypothetical protein n=1 Tax=Paenibacillus ferrarius TaxID=1469647 RepID=UPI001301F20D|nr:hypothetical protein [Paenibacillus ferrarius]
MMLGGFDDIATQAILKVVGIIIGILGVGFVIGAFACLLYFKIKWGMPVWEMIAS